MIVSSAAVMLAVPPAGWLEAVIAGVGAGDAVAGEGDGLAVADIGVGEGGGAVVDGDHVAGAAAVVQAGDDAGEEPLPVTLSAVVLS